MPTSRAQSLGVFESDLRGGWKGEFFEVPSEVLGTLDDDLDRGNKALLLPACAFMAVARSAVFPRKK
jgi:hypothetical protein